MCYSRLAVLALLVAGMTSCSGGGGGILVGEEKRWRAYLSLIPDKSHPPYIDEKTAPEWTPMARAIRKGDIDLARQLIAQGADINERISRKRQYTPLFFAVDAGNDEMVTLLLSAGADLNLTDNCGPIHPRIKRKDGYAPLHYAVWRGHHKIVKTLLRYGAKPDPIYECNPGSAPLTIAAVKGYHEIMDTLLDAGADLNEPGRQPFPILFIKSGTKSTLRSIRETAEHLIRRGADIHANQDEALLNAVETASADKYHKEYAGHVTWLVGLGLDVNRQDRAGWTPVTSLFRHCTAGDIELLRILYEAGAELKNQNGARTLLKAAKCANLEAVNFLLREGVDPNLVSDGSESVLIKAIRATRPYSRKRMELAKKSAKRTPRLTNAVVLEERQEERHAKGAAIIKALLDAGRPQFHRQGRQILQTAVAAQSRHGDRSYHNSA